MAAAGTIFLLLASLWVAALSAPAGSMQARNEWPVIGIVMKPLQEEYPDIKSNLTEVTESSYVQFVEGGGARAVAISYKWNETRLRAEMSRINGIVLTGGDTRIVIDGKMTDYGKGAQRIYNIALDMNHNGTYFPIWGTCLGYELILVATADDPGLLQNCSNCTNYSTFLRFANADEDPRANSRLFAAFPARHLHAMATENVTYNYHSRMVDNVTFYAHSRIVENFTLLAHSPWLNDSSAFFVSAIEHKVYPVYATQFHPEKWNYEVDPEEFVARTRDTIRLGHAFSNFFVEECRKNGNHFSDRKEETQNLIETRTHYYDNQYGYLYFI